MRPKAAAIANKNKQRTNQRLEKVVMFEFSLKRNGRGTVVASLFAILLVSSLSTAAETDSIVGTWVLAGADKLLPDGTRVADYGSNPHGLVIFTSDGYYSVQIYRAERLKFSSGDKFNGTPEEYKDASLSMSVSFGRYSVDPVKHTITFKRDRSSVPNLDDTTVVDPYELKGEELSWRVPARKDGSIPITVLRRARESKQGGGIAEIAPAS
jgi:hypothetical protein